LTRSNPVLSTLNYDLLLEDSLELSGHSYNHVISGSPPDNSIPVYKLHGSCNIVPDIPGSIRGMILNVDLHNAPPGVDVSGVDGAQLKTLDRRSLMAWLDKEDTLVPCIAAYHASKNIRDHGMPFKHLQSHWGAAIHRTEALFIIGVRLVLHDTHLWEPISKYKGKVYWVSRDPGPALAWAQVHGVDMAHFATDFKSFIPSYVRAF
jgi:hypothetical protein